MCCRSGAMEYKCNKRVGKSLRYNFGKIALFGNREKLLRLGRRFVRKLTAYAKSLCGSQVDRYYGRASQGQNKWLDIR